MRRIGIVTGTRAEYGLLARIISLLQQDSRFDTRVFACGTHLSPEFGMTIGELEKDGIEHVIAVEMLLSSGSRVGVAKSVGIAAMGFADAFSRESLDCLLVLGDRYEILAAVQTAMLMDIPVAHIHGGEVTEGAFDDCIRHAITKMANIHFPVTEDFARRICQMGESESSVYVVGTPGVDNIVNIKPMAKAELEQSLGFEVKTPLALVTYHPVTKASDASENDISPLVEAIKANPQLHYIITYPNADGGGKDIIDQWQTISDLPNVQIVPSLGFARYLSVMSEVECVIGNSSSGIIEAPAFHVATINIGTRQDGRPRSETVLDVKMSQSQIDEAIKLSTSEAFKQKAKQAVNPYGQGGAAQAIVDVLAKIDFEAVKIKTFIDR